MKRAWLLALLFVPAAAAFGAGEPAFEVFVAPDTLPDAARAGEPTIGIPWDSDDVFYQAYASTYRISFDNGTEWVDVTPPDQPAINLDPMLHADPVSGRVWAGGLFTACSVMMYTDDNGDSWDPSGNMCGIYAVDHQTIGSGPWADSPATSPLYDRAVYYCAHGEAISSPILDPAFSVASPTACATSQDGGVTWGDPVPWIGGCGSLHGHVRVSPATGFAAVPDANCAPGVGAGERLAGFAYSADNGLTWMSRTVEGSVAYSPFDNPSLAFGHDEGWLWYGQAADDGVFMALSKDEGTSWETLGEGMGDNATWLDVGSYHDPPIVEATFPDVMVGDDDRVAIGFIGLEDTDGDGTADEYADNNECDMSPEIRFWHYYIATSYDAGSTWTVTKVTDDPVQVGGVFQGQGNVCRNLLDFNDMDIDSMGRIHVAFADGCIADCAADPEEASAGTAGFRTAYATLIRQTDGKGLFAEFDGNETVAPTPQPTPEEPDEESPGLGVVALLAVLGAAMWVRRR